MDSPRRSRVDDPIQASESHTSDLEFQDEAHRQSAAVASSEHAEDDQAFIDAVGEMGSSPPGGIKGDVCP